MVSSKKSEGRDRTSRTTGSPTKVKSKPETSSPEMLRVSVWQPIYRVQETTGTRRVMLAHCSRCCKCEHLVKNDDGVPPVKCPKCGTKEIVFEASLP